MREHTMHMRAGHVHVRSSPGTHAKIRFVGTTPPSPFADTQLPEVAAMVYRNTYHNQKFISPDPKLDWSANLAHMMGYDSEEVRGVRGGRCEREPRRQYDPAGSCGTVKDPSVPSLTLSDSQDYVGPSRIESIGSSKIMRDRSQLLQGPGQRTLGAWILPGSESSGVGALKDWSPVTRPDGRLHSPHAAGPDVRLHSPRAAGPDGRLHSPRAAGPASRLHSPHAAGPAGSLHSPHAAGQSGSQPA
eukprot:364290-Chlamydomonas_euryale.AAC.4